MRHAFGIVAASLALLPMLSADTGAPAGGSPSDQTAADAGKVKAPEKGKFTVTLTGGVLGTDVKTLEFGIQREVNAAKEIGAVLGLEVSSKENVAKRTAANSELLKAIKGMYADRIYKDAADYANANGLAALPAYLAPKLFTNEAVRAEELANMERIAASDLAPKVKEPAAPATPAAA